MRDTASQRFYGHAVLYFGLGFLAGICLVWSLFATILLWLPLRRWRLSDVDCS